MRVGATIRADAPAKLNLFLEVLGKREDGFHEIETLVAAISIYDTLYFTGNEEGKIELHCEWASGMEARRSCGSGIEVFLGDLPSDADNLVWKAVDLFRRAAGVPWGARIRVVKRIPAAAGLGGASSDAAAALLAANAVWNVGWDASRLAELAAEVGSDVPFFLGGACGGTMAVCRGRGERVLGIPTQTRFHLVVVRPPGGLSTAQVYAHCRAADAPRSVQPLVTALQAGKLAPVARQLFNRLESAASQLSPWIEPLHSRFQHLDVLGFRMSGSGSSWFGLCRHQRHARRVSALLRAAGVGQVFAVSSVSPQCRIAAVSA